MRAGAALPAAALPAAGAAAAVALMGWRAGALTRGGALAAWTVGTGVLLGTGWGGGAVLAAFFVSSSLVSRLAAGRAPTLLDPKGERRDARQVYANGGAALAGALAGGMADSGKAGSGMAGSGPRLWLVTGSLAAAAADTWATSAGSLSRVRPRLILTGHRVPPGTSGGITPAGCVGAALGAGLVGLTGALAAGAPRLLPAATLIGFAGMLADSAVGAGLQGRFHCPRCDQPSEWRVHRCGTATLHRGGLRWLDNDGVNLLATTSAAGLALAAWRRTR